MAKRKPKSTWYENQLEWQKKYNKEMTVGISCRLNKETDAELIEVWRLVPNKNKLVKDAIIRYAKEELGLDIRRRV